MWAPGKEEAGTHPRKHMAGDAFKGQRPWLHFSVALNGDGST